MLFPYRAVGVWNCYTVSFKFLPWLFKKWTSGERRAVLLLFRGVKIDIGTSLTLQVGSQSSQQKALENLGVENESGWRLSTAPEIITESDLTWNHDIYFGPTSEYSHLHHQSLNISLDKEFFFEELPTLELESAVTSSGRSARVTISSQRVGVEAWRRRYVFCFSH